MKKLGVAVVITISAVLTVLLGLCNEGHTGGVWKGSDPGPDPPVFFAPERSDQYAKDAGARLSVLKKRIDSFANDARKTAEDRELAGQVKELKARALGLEDELKTIRSAGKRDSEGLKAEFDRKMDELELLLNRSAASMN